MNKPSHDDVKSLLSEIVLPFYEIDRDMLVPTRPEGERRLENDAEHSWSVALIAATLLEHIDPTLDVGLVTQFGIVHDLVEVYADDVSVWDDKAALAAKAENEAKAAEKIKAKFSHFPWLVDTIEAYERQDTNEALYVKAS